MNNPASPTHAAAAATSNYRWYALAILFLVSVLNTVDKMLIPALAEPIRLEFNLTDSELGFLVGMVFSVAYAIASLPMGMLIDRVNRTRLVATLLIVWSLMTLVCARASSFLGLALCRIGVAAAESGGNPTSLSLIGDYFPREQRGRAVGIFSANTALAGMLVFSVAGYVAANHGWRQMFVVAAIPGFILAAIVLLTLKEPPRGAFEAQEDSAAAPKAAFREIIATIWAHKTLLWVTAGGVLVIMAQAGGSAFTAAFFVREHALSLTQAGLTSGLIIAPATAIGTIAGGYLSDRASARSAGGGCRFVALATLMAVPFGVIAYTTSVTSLAIPLLFVFQVLGMCFYGATLATIIELAPIRVRGSVITYLMLVLNLGGYGLGPQVVGTLSDFLRASGIEASLGWGLAGSTALMFCSAVCYYVASAKMKAEAATSQD